MNASIAGGWIDYDYAILRVVPRVHLCSFVNVGVVLHARTAGFIGMATHVDRSQIARLFTDLDLDVLDRSLDAYERVCRGQADGHPISLLPPSERFHWLTAPRSAVIQCSEVHGGRTRDPEATLRRLVGAHVGQTAISAATGTGT
jgi:hypothetical protein